MVMIEIGDPTEARQALDRIHFSIATSPRSDLDSAVEDMRRVDRMIDALDAILKETPEVANTRTYLVQGRISKIGAQEPKDFAEYVRRAILAAGWDEWAVKTSELTINTSHVNYVHWTCVLTVKEE